MKKQNDSYDEPIRDLYLNKYFSIRRVSETLKINRQFVYRRVVKMGINRQTWAIHKEFRKCTKCKAEYPISEYNNRWRYLCKTCQAEYYYNRSLIKSGVDVENYTKLVEYQNSLCAICGKATTKKLFIDHDHITGYVRGLLCSSCNFGIGMFKDDIDLLESSIKYLNNPPVLQLDIKIKYTPRYH